jgi:hypothetical protein
MERINQGFAIAALLSAAQASYASPFPADGEPAPVPVAWTYADRHVDGPDQRMGSAFPADGEEKSVPVTSTYADLYAGHSEEMIAALSED